MRLLTLGRKLPPPAGQTILAKKPVPPDLTEIQNPRVHYFGDYELLEEIARGGMGVVYRARQITLNRCVAVKMILAGELASEAEVKRFRTEAEAAANLQHPNIVAIHEVGEHEDRHYFSMDYVQGNNLADALRQNPISSRHAAELLQTICEAIHYAHQRGTLHRDLKPQNILIDAAGQPRITDFGLAKRIDRESGLTRTGLVMGSPSYMSPEQAAGRHDQVGPATDVYSLGAILYFLLTACPPFQGPTAIATVQKVLQEEPLHPRKLNEQVPVDLETICLRCLEKRPERRYHSARAVAEELGRFLNQEPIQARPAGLLRRCWSWSVRHPSVLTGAVSVLVLLLAGYAYALREKIQLMEWKAAHPGLSRALATEDFFSQPFIGVLFAEFFLMQMLPLAAFLRHNPMSRVKTWILFSYSALAMAQVALALCVIMKTISAATWLSAPREFFWGQQAWLVVLPALTNAWFAMYLGWLILRDLRAKNAGDQPEDFAGRRLFARFAVGIPLVVFLSLVFPWLFLCRFFVTRFLKRDHLPPPWGED